MASGGSGGGRSGNHASQKESGGGISPGVAEMAKENNMPTEGLTGQQISAFQKMQEGQARTGKELVVSRDGDWLDFYSPADNVTVGINPAGTPATYRGLPNRGGPSDAQRITRSRRNVAGARDIFYKPMDNPKLQSEILRRNEGKTISPQGVQYRVNSGKLQILSKSGTWRNSTKPKSKLERITRDQALDQLYSQTK